MCTSDKRQSGALLIVVSMILVHTGLLAWAAHRDSPTWDEVGHFGAGMSHWRRGNFHAYRVNPPLVRTLACLPVATLGPRFDVPPFELKSDPFFRSEFEIGRAVADSLGPRYFESVTYARWACVPLSALGAWICFRWAGSLYGVLPGIVACLLWCTCPHVLGHGHLMTPDVGATALGLAAMYSFWGWRRDPTWARALGTGVILGLAELSKATWVILFFLWPVLWISTEWLTGSRGRARQRLCHQVTKLAVAYVTAVCVMNIGYGFEQTFTPLGRIPFTSDALGGGLAYSNEEVAAYNRFQGTFLGELPVPLPENYVRGIDVQKRDFEQGMYSYLRGEWRDRGWWYYYFYAGAVKTPLGSLALMLLAIWAFCRRKCYSADLRDEVVLLAPAVVVMTLVSSQTGFSHHLRYVLPVLPYLYIYASKLARSVEFGHFGLASVVAALVASAAVSSLRVFPHSLSYFNELVGGPERGHLHLANSNTDWGQDLLNLKRWLDSHPGVPSVGLVYDMPYVNPQSAGIAHRPVPRMPARGRTSADPDEEVGPVPGWYVVSVNALHARDGKYDYFQLFDPIDRIGYSMFVFNITVTEANSVRAKLGLPVFGTSAANEPTR